MGAVTTMNILDGEDTPVTRVFEPVTVGVSSAAWETQTDPYVGRNKIVVSHAYPKGPPSRDGSGRNIKVMVRLETPILEPIGTETASGILPTATVGYRPQCEIKFTLPERSTAQDRENLRTLLRNLLGHARVIEAVDEFSFPF